MAKKCCGHLLEHVENSNKEPVKKWRVYLVNERYTDKKGWLENK